jgi:hypothetical protein
MASTFVVEQKTRDYGGKKTLDMASAFVVGLTRDCVGGGGAFPII